MLLVLAILVGLFAGVTIGLIYVIVICSNMQRRLDRERMLALNKAFVRDGQARLFSQEIIAGDDTEFEPEQKARVLAKSISPFRNGLVKAKEAAEKPSPAIKLPDPIKEKIIAQKDAIANGARS